MSRTTAGVRLAVVVLVGVPLAAVAATPSTPAHAPIAMSPAAAAPATASPVRAGDSGVTGVTGLARVSGRAAVRTPEQVLRRMSLRQQVGQLFMVGTPATRASQDALAAVTGRHVGNVMLTGRSYGGAEAPRRVAGALQSRATLRATRGVRLLVATDQEGGLVQVLNGGLFSDIPSALQQGTWAPRRLTGAATTWARQLRSAGVNMNLAPVLDTVPSPEAARSNPPIGAFDREFGFDPAVVAAHGTAVATGMLAGGVVPAIKHFPGLGRVHANTDTTAGVTDRVTRRRDAYLRPFGTAIRAGAPVVMMSSAYYSRLDPRHPAAFSPFVVRTVLRGDLGFDGVVISDDLGSARQVARWRPGQRAVAFLAAGGDLVLTVAPSTLPAMYDAVLHRAARSPAFRARVARSALRVLRLKAQHRLL